MSKKVKEQIQEPVAESSEVSQDEQKEEKKLEIVSYEYGDLSVYCHVCGKETLVPDKRFQNIKGGLTFPLMCNNAHAISLSCGHCAAILSLHFVPSVNPPQEEKEENVGKKEEIKNDIQEENKEK
jgi:hypothetical protein